jgi:hypothetical protein
VLLAQDLVANTSPAVAAATLLVLLLSKQASRAGGGNAEVQADRCQWHPPT